KKQDRSRAQNPPKTESIETGQRRDVKSPKPKVGKKKNYQTKGNKNARQNFVYIAEDASTGEGEDQVDRKETGQENRHDRFRQVKALFSNWSILQNRSRTNLPNE